MGTLEYKSPDSAPRVIALEESHGEVRLLFPPPPMWLGLLGVVFSALVAGVFIAGSAWFITLIYRMYVAHGAPIPGTMWLLPLFHASVAVLYLAGAVYTAAHFRRWGRTPKILRVSGDELIWSVPGFWRLSERRYAAAEIVSFDVLPVRDIFGRKTTFKLRCRRKRGFSIERPFTTRDPELPARVQRAFREALRLPQ